MLSVEEIRTLCKDDPEIKQMTDDEIELIQSQCYRIAAILLETCKKSKGKALKGN